MGRERGQSLVEFAVILPLLLLIVLAAVDLGMGFRTYIALTNAAREGARAISIYPGERDRAEDRIAQEANRVLTAGEYIVRLVPDKSNYAAGEQVAVEVSHNYKLLFGVIPGQPAIAFTASSTMVVLYE